MQTASCKKLVLVVGSRRWISRLIEVNMQRAGWRVEVAATAAEAWERIAADRPDRIVVDELDPQQDAHELLRRLKADPATAEIPVVMIGGEHAEGLPE